MFLLGGGLLALGLVVMESAAAQRGVVKGASVVNVRSGPGTGHRAFATLLEGDEVEVMRVEGVWLVVRTRDGSNGYVHKDYIALGTAVEPISVPLGSALDAAGKPLAGASETATGTEGSEQPIAETASMQQRAEPAQPARSSEEEGGRDDIQRDDIQRLLGMTEELHRMVAEIANHREPGRDAAREPSAFSSGWALAVSALLGGFIGAAYGRARERRRRTRVRF